MTILVKKDSISSKIKTVYYVMPASVRAIFIQDFARGEISYKVKKVIGQINLPDYFFYVTLIALIFEFFPSLVDLFLKFADQLFIFLFK